MKKKVTITLTLSESTKQFETVDIFTDDIISPWAPIIVGCLEDYVEQMNESLVVNRNRIVKITPNGSVTYVNQNGLMAMYDTRAIKFISKLCDKLKSSPKVVLSDLNVCEIKVILKSLRNVNRVIGDGTDEEIIKNIPFAMMHSELLDALESASMRNALCDDECATNKCVEDTVKPNEKENDYDAQ